MTVAEKIRTAESPLFTFELLPPLKGHTLERTYKAVERLLKYEPAYINFTAHADEVKYVETADGQYRKRTLRKRPGTVAMAAAVRFKYNITVVPHLICTGFNRQETENALIDMHFLGIHDVLALRGDPPRGSKQFIPEADGHAHTNELVEQIANMNKGLYLDEEMEESAKTRFCIGVAGYPEKHLEAPNIQTDLDYLKQKVEAGADYIVTQMFFDNQKYFDFVEQCRQNGIQVPIVPGLKPLSALTDINLIPQTFSIDLPEALFKEAVECKTNEEIRQLGIAWAIEQSRELLKKGVPGIHYYTLGRSDNIARIVETVY